MLADLPYNDHMDIHFQGGSKDGTTLSLDVSPHHMIEFQYSDPTGRHIPSLTELYEPTGDHEERGGTTAPVFRLVELPRRTDPLDARRSSAAS